MISYTKFGLINGRFTGVCYLCFIRPIERDFRLRFPCTCNFFLITTHVLNRTYLSTIVVFKFLEQTLILSLRISICITDNVGAVGSINIILNNVFWLEINVSKLLSVRMRKNCFTFKRVLSMLILFFAFTQSFNTYLSRVVYIRPYLCTPLILSNTAYCTNRYIMENWSSDFFHYFIRNHIQNIILYV